MRGQLEASRQFVAEAAGATFTLRLPTDHVWRVTLESHRDAHGHLMEAQAFRGILIVSVVGWSGVTADMILPLAEKSPIPHSAEALRLLFDNRQDIADELMVQVAAKLRERRVALEAARKN